MLALGGLTYGAIEAGTAGLAAPRVLAAFAVAVAGLAVFVAAQARGAHPMMPLDLVRSRTVVIANVTGFAFIVGYYGLPFLMSLYLQQVRGLSALAAGAAFVPTLRRDAATAAASVRAIKNAANDTGRSRMRGGAVAWPSAAGRCRAGHP